MDSTIKTILLIFLFVLIFYLLSVLSSILLPLVLAFLLALMFQPLIALLKKIKVPSFLIFPAVSIITLGIIFGILNIIYQTSTDIAVQKDYLTYRFQTKVEGFFNWIQSISGGTINTDYLYKQINEIPKSDWFTNTAGNVITSISSFSGSFVMFAIYYIVLLSGMSGYKRYVKYVGGDKSTTLSDTYEKVQKSIFSYMILKTLINIGSGLLVTLICLIFGVKFAVFWGFITYLVLYIPSFGSIIATVFPVLMAIIQFDSLNKVLFFFILIFVVLFINGSIVEPKIMGTRLRLNTVTVIFGLVFWGYLWGVPGMMLSVPLMVILKLVFEHFPTLSIVSRLMGYPEKETEKVKA
ncbi:MAG: AI-2E family transporter [Ignavibacteriae bacterium]|nr:AI-2E family transporter [Ignavibacteriota bacterium]